MSLSLTATSYSGDVMKWKDGKLGSIVQRKIAELRPSRLILWTANELFGEAVREKVADIASELKKEVLPSSNALF